jgi:hypothetical protein
MLEWTGAGAGSPLMMLMLHDDAGRTYAYSPASGLPDTTSGTFPPSLMEGAGEKGWTVISMKNDWARIFASEEQVRLQACFRTILQQMKTASQAADTCHQRDRLLWPEPESDRRPRQERQ